MMKYKYRFIYAFIMSFIMLLLGFYYDLQPQWRQLAELHKMHSALSQTLWMLAKRLPKEKSHFVAKNNFSSNRSKDDLLAELFNIIQLNGLTVQSTKIGEILNRENTAILPIHLVVRGRFINMYGFMQTISHQIYPAVIANFSFKIAKQDNLYWAMDLLIFLQEDTFANNNADFSMPLKQRSPFCLIDNTGKPFFFEKHVEDSQLQKIPLTQLKMVGCLQEDNKASGIISLPNNHLVDVTVGMLIGKEQGIITRIQRAAVIVELPNKTQYVLRM